MTTAFPHKNFKSFLLFEYKQRQIKNPHYSLRRFAADLKLEPSFLSKLINGKRRITLSVIERIGKSLSLSPEEIQIFKLDIFKTMDSEVKGRTKNSKRTKFKAISLEMARSFAGWIDFAILELYAIPGLDLNAKKISSLLQTPEEEVQMTLDRLENFKLLKRDEYGNLCAPDPHHTLPESPYTSAELRRTQGQFLIKAMEALEDEPLKRRDHSGMTLALREDQIPEAKKLIKNFRRRFMALMQKSKPYDCIYQLSISLYPLSKNF